MNPKALFLGIVAVVAWWIPARPLADQPIPSEYVTESCALAATPRALQTFSWLTCAPEPRSVWQSSERPRDPDVVTTPRGSNQLPPMRIVSTPPVRTVVVASRGWQTSRVRSAPTPGPRQYSSLSHGGSARGGAAKLIDFAN